MTDAADTGLSLWERRRLLAISWEVAGKLLAGLADDVRASGFVPDVVVGVSRAACLRRWHCPTGCA